MEHTYEKHLDLLDRNKNPLGCIPEPALSFDSEQCPPDMLHLKKGIISKLVNQLVDWAIVQRKEDALLAEMRKNKIPFVSVFQNSHVVINFSTYFHLEFKT